MGQGGSKVLKKCARKSTVLWEQSIFSTCILKPFSCHQYDGFINIQEAFHWILWEGRYKFMWLYQSGYGLKCFVLILDVTYSTYCEILQHL